MTVVLFALSLTHGSGGIFEVATADPGTAGDIGATRCLCEIFRPATWFEVIDECPAVDKPHRTGCPASVIEGAITTKRLTA